MGFLKWLFHKAPTKNAKYERGHRIKKIRITKEKASIYNEPPVRHISRVEEEQEAVLQSI